MNNGREVKPMTPGKGAIWGVDMGKSPDYVGISSEEYKQLKKCESKLAHYKQEAKKIPIYCSYADWLDTGYCTPKVQCPQICPKWRGGGKDV